MERVRVEGMEKPLPMAVLEAAVAVSLGCSYESAAEYVGKSRRTLFNWKESDDYGPLFRHLLEFGSRVKVTSIDAARKVTLDEARGEFASLLGLSLDAYKEVLVTGDLKDKLTVAKDVFDRNMGKATQKIEQRTTGRVDVAHTHTHELSITEMQSLLARLTRGDLPPSDMPMLEGEVIGENGQLPADA